MSSRMKLASGVAVVFVVVLGAAITLSAREQPVALPSPSPTPTIAPETPSPSPSPTVSPSPTATVAATVAPTPRPRPTTNVAGQQLMTYYFQIRAAFPIFPPTPQLDFDEP